MYQHITQPYQGDPILSLMQTFNQDPRQDKINLSIGVYYDNHGKTELPNSVAIAAQNVGTGLQNYLPMEGHAGFRAAVTQWLLGKEHPALLQNRVVVVQTLGGSGALKLCADFMHRYFPHATAHVSHPTWDNHRSIFSSAGIRVSDYPYYNLSTQSIDFAALCDYVTRLPAKDILVLHPCCHNPTGVDLSHQQWDSLLNIIAQRELIAFMDMAYHGLGENFSADSYAITRAIGLNIPVWVSYSFSKNMGLYGQRVGALLAVTPSAQEAQLVLGELTYGVRCIYSSPPAQGVLTAYGVLSSSQLCQQWQEEVAQMRQRIQNMRQTLYTTLSEKLPMKNFDFLIQQRGMFSYTGLSCEQVYHLRNKWGIYLLDTGRMCIAGLNDSNIHLVAEALAQTYG